MTITIMIMIITRGLYYYVNDNHEPKEMEIRRELSLSGMVMIAVLMG